MSYRQKSVSGVFDVGRQSRWIPFFNGMTNSGLDRIFDDVKCPATGMTSSSVILYLIQNPVSLCFEYQSRCLQFCNGMTLLGNIADFI